MNIYLVGYRGTGKSTLGPLIAQRLSDDQISWSAVDLDEAIERAAGQSIAEIFAQLGEPQFRDLESTQLSLISRQTHTVVATGGGVVIRQENRDLLRQGWVVWLQASAATIYERLTQDAQRFGNRRPALTESKDLLDEIQQVLARRLPWYEEVAHLRISTEQPTETLVSEIILAYRNEGFASPNC